MTKYERWYKSIMERAKTRVLEGYSERHHIIPKCMGGIDAASNIVRLTAEEHFVAHQLLVKIHPGHAGLAFAALQLASNANGGLLRSKQYGWLRRAHATTVSASLRGKKRNAEFCQAVRDGKLASDKHQGRPFGLAHTAETKNKIRAKALGRTRKMPEAERQLRSKINGSPEMRAKQSVAQRAAQQNPEVKKRKSDSLKAYWAKVRNGEISRHV